MFCKNCGNNINEQMDFCPNCGTRIERLVMPQNMTMTEVFSNRSRNFINPLINKIKLFFKKYKKQTIICCSGLVVVVIGIMLFYNFYDFTKLSWEKDYGDYTLEYISGGQLKLKAKAFDKNDIEISEIEYRAEDGTIEINDGIALWTLPNKEGKYEIFAVAPSGKKIKKEITVISANDDFNDDLPSGLITEDIDENTDSDNDTITNFKEEELGTNPYSADTDSDGLLDQYEINVIKTDPLMFDTDNDELSDGSELDLDLDPLKKDSKGDGFKDGERNVSYLYNNTGLGVTVELNGKGNIPDITVDVFENTSFYGMDGLLDTVYNFYTSGTVNSASVKINYDLQKVLAEGLNEDNLTLYYFDEESKLLEAVPTVIDKENKILSVTLEHFSKYVIGDSNVVLTNTTSQIMAVIDNSVSMYTYDQLSNAGYYDITGADGNDSEFKRLSLTNNLVDMFTGNYEFGVAEFSGNYVNLEEFTSNKEDIKQAVNSMNMNFNSNTSGTNIITALESGIAEFVLDDNNHVLILLTDGKNTSGSLSSKKSSIIADAKERNVKVCVIGLGEDIDTNDLTEIAISTGCDYYHASDSSALDEIYSIVGSDINYNLTDTDGDGKTDGTIIADSGFITSRDGLSFFNPSTVEQSTGGLCYGFATFANLRYRGMLPTSLGEMKIKKWMGLKVGNVNWYSSGYDLSKTYFETEKNLYDYKLQDEAVRLRIAEFPNDIRDRVENGIFYVSDKYYNLFSNIGISYTLKKYTGDIKGIKQKQTVGYLDLENELFEKNANNEDVQLLKAIWRLFIIQAEDEEIDFSTSPDKAYNELINELQSNNPIVIGIGGDHAVNAIRLIQDNDNANKFKLEIYDSNHPGKRRFINVTRSKTKKLSLDYTAWTNDYEYSFKYEDYENKNIGVKLNYPTID